MGSPPEKNHQFLSSASFWQPEWVPPSSAWIEHAPFAFWLIGELRPRTIAELGTHTGYSAMVFCQAIQKFGYDSRLSAVDTWQGDSQAGFYDNDVFNALNNYNQQHYDTFSKLIRTTFDEARAQFPKGSIDLLHIDGLHTYEAVKHDFETWLPCISNRGIIIFHDTQVRENDFGVWRLWKELREQYPHFEFHHGYGLGILGVGSDLPEILRSLFSVKEDSALAEEIRSTYSKLGKKLLPKEPQPTLESIPEQPKEVADSLVRSKDYVPGLILQREKPSKQEQMLLKEIQSLRKIIESAQNWQRRSWFKRAFHRWHAPALPASKSTSATDREASLLPKWTAKLLNTVFNPVYYLAKNPSAATSNLTPLEHYRTLGWKENFKPHPMFDVAWYLQQNPDVAEAGWEPLQHYLEAGWKESRTPHRFFDPDFYLEKYTHVREKNLEPLGHYVKWGWIHDLKPSPHGYFDWMREITDLCAFDNKVQADAMLGPQFQAWLESKEVSRPGILLVTHESKRTGTSIILLNLARRLREKYHVILFDLCEGSQKADFLQASDYYVGFGDKNHSRVHHLSLTLRLLLERCPIYFALVNSLAAEKALTVLAQKNIPTVHLIDEFAEMCRMSHNITSALFNAGKTVFPAQIVLDSTLRVSPELPLCRTLILPQGYCATPPSLFDSDQQKVKKKLRPVGWEDSVVIIGMGGVQYREGVDLFLICAGQLIGRNLEKKVRFVWIGAGFEEKGTSQYSDYLGEHLRKVSANGAVCIVDETMDAESVYAQADIFFVSSRQAPFPLIAQGAICHGLPVLCFAEATGTAEILRTEPVMADCVIPYLDIEMASRQLQKLVDDPDLRKKIGSKGRQMVAEFFDFEKYATAIETAALGQVERTRVEINDRKVIEKSGVLDLAYLRSPNHAEIWADPAWWYVRSWASGIHLRKPCPGFHPGIYAERHGFDSHSPSDPLAHYLQNGRPFGPWINTLINPLPDEVGLPFSRAKIALHIHLFYADMAGEIARRLQRNKTEVDLFITVPDEASAETAREIFSLWPGKRLEVFKVPNLGRDIGPFLTTLGNPIFRDYDIVGHLHTKKSFHIKSSTEIELWTDFLFENLIGGEHAMMDAILSAMMTDPAIGIVFPDDPHLFGWGKNLPYAEELYSRLKLGSSQPEKITFPAGTFFWARTKALQRLFDLHLSWEDYPEEPLPHDGTMLHAIERLLPLISESAGFQTAVSHVPGITR